MIAFNRGEWSELYCILFLMIKPKLEIVNKNLETITSELFEIKKIIKETNLPLEYEIVKNRIVVYTSKQKVNEYSQDEIQKQKELLYTKIKNVTSINGSFVIEEIQDFLRDFALGQTIKSGSQNKEDIEVLAKDFKKNVQCYLRYSIKSFIGSPPTLLNASKHTNFKYKVEGLNDTLMNKVNSIKTRTKLVDRLKFLKENNCIIKYESVLSDCFASNLRMIDSLMDKYIGNALLYSYNNSKILKNAFVEANGIDNLAFANKKIWDFLSAICFGCSAGKPWNGENSVNGGIMIVKENGHVVVLDLIYHSNQVKDYLINNSRLDSPSATRYHMLEIYKENNNYYFNLNLQVRCIKNKKNIHN